MPSAKGRAAFDEDARLYDRARPSYPDELIEDILSYSGIPPEGRILEIGCGTGQATRPFAMRGYPMLCLEPGANLAAVARDNFRDHPAVEIETVSLEDWPLQEDAFDLVISATAFHWIPEEIGFPKAARALKDGGAIALFWNKHGGALSDVFLEMNRAYRIHAPEMAFTKVEIERRRGLIEESRRGYAKRIERTGLFEDVEAKAYPWSEEYTTERYLSLLDTYSDHRPLPADRKRKLYDEISRVIERMGGTIAKDYVAVLYLAKKRQ